MGLDTHTRPKLMYEIREGILFILRSVWGQRLILPLISYGMKNEADKWSFLEEWSLLTNNFFHM